MSGVRLSSRHREVSQTKAIAQGERRLRVAHELRGRRDGRPVNTSSKFVTQGTTVLCHTRVHTGRPHLVVAFHRRPLQNTKVHVGFPESCKRAVCNCTFAESANPGAWPFGDDIFNCAATEVPPEVVAANLASNF